MAIDGLILLDNTGRPIIQSGFRSTASTYPLIHIDAFNNALSKALRPGDVDPVIYIPAYNIADSPSACCHVQCADMRFLCPVSGNVDPLVGFAFLQTFIDILREYFGNLSAATLKENFDVVYQLLEETLDSGGHPLTTSPNALRDVVLPPSLLNKLLNVAGANINSTINSGSGLGSAGGPFSSPIPWRKAGLKYTSNEIYFDFVEELKAIVNKHGVPLSSNVLGKIETSARLSGTPDLLLTFTSPQILSDCAFHPCVRLQRWTRDKTFSFVPPDGKFILAEYRYSPNNSASSVARLAAPSAPAASLGKDNVPIPFVVKITFDIQDSSASFDITLTSRLTTRPLENVNVELNLGEGALGIKCIAARGTGGLGRGGVGALDMGLGGNAGASWAFDSKKRVLKWEIASVPPSSSWNLRGSFSTPPVAPRPSHALQVRFEIQSHTFSTLKVEQLQITGEAYKPYKGVRGRSTGYVEWRW
ncbi:Mu homology domain-containing protein [Crassisporium funariophilum]|nr:Mu homology domain-containing protein [Crassisporium funariophilum]